MCVVPTKACANHRMTSVVILQHSTIDQPVQFHAAVEVWNLEIRLIQTINDLSYGKTTCVMMKLMYVGKAAMNTEKCLAVEI
jgi:hypothetical protein